VCIRLQLNDSLSGADANPPALPQPSFPARIAVARVQPGDYQSSDTVSAGNGRFAVVISSETSLADAHADLGALPHVAGVAILNSILLPDHINSDADLRRAADRLSCDMLLLYTFNDAVRVDDHEIGPLGILSLGTLPNHEAKVVVTAEAALMDVRTGYIYSTAEAAGEESQFSGALDDEQRHRSRPHQGGEESARRTDAAIRSVVE